MCLKKTNMILMGILVAGCGQQGSDKGLTSSDEFERQSKAIDLGETQQTISEAFLSQAGVRDRQSALALVIDDGDALELLEPALRNDKEIVLAAVNETGMALQFASADLKHDEDIVMAAVENRGDALRYAAEPMRQNKSVVLTSLTEQSYSRNLDYVNDALRKDKEFILAAGEINIHAFAIADKSLFEDDHFFTEMVKRDGMAIEHASLRQMNNKLIVLTAVTQNGNALVYASDKFKKDKEVVLAAVKQAGVLALYFADVALQSDEDVLSALKR